MEVRAQEAIFYITTGLCTFLAIILSYRWLACHLKKISEEVKKKKEKAEEEVGKGDAKDEVKDGEMKKVEEEEQMVEAEEEEEEEEEDSTSMEAAGCPFSFLMSQSADFPAFMPAGPNAITSKDSLDDLLIDGSEIQPLSEEEKEELEESKENMDRRRVKELEEEVVKSMTDQQLDEEARARQAQLEAIFNLMQDNKERFGMASVDDVQNQYKLYV